MKKTNKKRIFSRKKWRGKTRFFCRKAVLACTLVMLMATTLAAQEQKVSIDVKQAGISLVFQQIKEQTGLNFMYNAEQLAPLSPVTLRLQNVTVDSALTALFAGHPFEWQYDDNYIIIKQKEADKKPLETITITGKVKDSDGNLLPGATVQIKSTTVGTATDANGEYILNLPKQDNLTLVFSFVGLETQEVKYTNQKEINVTLEESAEEIEEVVVTGMFTRRAESFTGSATTFKKEDILRMGNQNLLQSLSNLDPAFRITENLEFGSDPNHTPDVQLRGQTSFPNLQGEYEGNPNQPLFILDGFETTIEKVYDLDMNRVASVTLLKDAAAKAIYGSKAGNGVVVIETIRPKAGELRVYYSGDYGLEVPDLTGYNLMNAEEKLAYETKIGMYSYSATPDIITAEESYKKVYDDVQRGVDTYWLSQPLRTGFSHKHSLILEGGDSRMRYQLGISYNKITGVMKESDRNTLNLNTTLSYTYNNLIFRNTTEFTRNWANNSPYGSFSEYVTMNPYWAPYDENGNLNKVFIIHSGSTDGNGDEEVYNPLYNATLNTKNTSYYTEIRDNFSADWKISKAFRIVGSFSYSRSENGSDRFYPSGHTMFIHYDENGLSDRKGRYTKTDGFTESVNAQAGLNFNKIFGEHLLFANLTYNMATSHTNTTSTIAEGFGNDFMDDISFATKYETNGKPGGSNNKVRETGVIIALNYSYADRYLFDASLRRSASSVYGSDNRWGTFWSLGIGWNLQHERFLAKSDWLQQFKLRASVGYTGTQNVDPSVSRARYEYYDYTYDNKIGSQLVAMPNEKLKWQRNLDWNFGTDITLKDFLTLRADYYIQITDNLLSDISLPPSSGFSSYKENLGKIENKGYEIAVMFTPWRNNDKRAYISFSLNGLHNKNKIKEIHDIFKNSNEEQNSSLDEEYDANDGDPTTEENMDKYLNKYTKPATLYYEGCSMTAIWGVQSLGINPANGQEMYLTKDKRSVYTWSSEDQIVIGDTEPKLSGSMSINAGYKGFTFSLTASYKFGGDLYNSDLIARMENVTGKENLDKRIWEAWQEPGDISPYRATRITSNYNSLSNRYTKPTSRFVQKNNELYISSVNMGYEFANTKWMKKCSLERLKVTFYMNELVRLSSIDIERGTSYPFARNFSLSLQATF